MTRRLFLLCYFIIFIQGCSTTTWPHKYRGATIEDVERSFRKAAGVAPLGFMGPMPSDCYKLTVSAGKKEMDSWQEVKQTWESCDQQIFAAYESRVAERERKQPLEREAELKEYGKVDTRHLYIQSCIGGICTASFPGPHRPGVSRDPDIMIKGIYAEPGIPLSVFKFVKFADYGQPAFGSVIAVFTRYVELQ